ncbi:MAG: FG-GAP repeat protein, partial [Rhizobiaceae bacterium]|nr:FG-GAP repeat protein [Rhizobiaceae bacterium]
DILGLIGKAGDPAAVGITNDSAPVLLGSFTGAIGAGEQIEVLRNGVKIGSADISGSTWSYADSNLVDGETYVYTVRAIDAYGNVGTESASRSIKIDTTAPSVATIAQITNDYGTFGDFKTYAETVVASGTAEAGAVLRIFNGMIELHTVTADSKGIWQSESISLAGLAVGGKINLRVVAIDAAGNSAAGVTQDIVKTAAPAATIASIDTSALAATQGLYMYGVNTGLTSALLGYSVAGVGDINSDGIDDFAVSAPKAGAGAGSVYFIYGGQSLGWSYLGKQAIFPNSMKATVGFILQDGVGGTSEIGDGTTLPVNIGDINGDGLADFAVSAPGSDYLASNSGEVFVLFGKTNGYGTVDSQGVARLATNLINENVGFTIVSRTSGSYLENIVGVGDQNNDGISDFLVSSYQYTSDGVIAAGRVWMVYGTTSWGGLADPYTGRTTLDIANVTGTRGFVLTSGKAVTEGVGHSISNVGDVNGDGKTDFMIADNTSSGASVLVYGKANTAAFDWSAPTVGSQTKFLGSGTEYAGVRVSSAGDVNGDGISDFIVGAYYAGSSPSGAGAAYVLFGGAHWSTKATFNLGDITATTGFKIVGSTYSGYLGWSVSSAGDFNGDGIDDIIVGARGEDSNRGNAWLIYGTASGFGTGTLPTLTVATMPASKGFAIRGEQSGDGFGYSVSAAGDVNGDGLDDLIVGAPLNDDSNPNTNTNSGAAYIIYGTGAGGRIASGTAAADFITGTAFADQLTGGGGADTLLGDGGGDKFYVSDTTFARIDGGAGSDTLFLSGADLHLNLTALGKGVITNMETIDITGTGDQTLTLTAQGLLDISSTTNTLVVDGNAGDKVVATGFADSGTDTTYRGGSYSVYTATFESHIATLWIDNEITEVIVA